MAGVYGSAVYFVKHRGSSETQGISSFYCEYMGVAGGVWVGKSLKWSHISRMIPSLSCQQTTLWGQWAGSPSFLQRWFIIHSRDISWAPVMCKAPDFKPFRMQEKVPMYKTQILAFSLELQPYIKDKYNKNLLQCTVLSHKYHFHTWSLPYS